MPALSAEPEAERVLDGERPWPGLVSFTEPARDFFFGRAAETDELLRRVRRDRATLLFGLSGLGKTSILQAGLFPRLRDQAVVPVLVRLDFSGATLGLADQIKEMVRQALRAAEIHGPEIARGETLWEVFHRAGPEFRDRLGRPVTIVVVFDQFEEVFTLGLGRPESRAEAQAFLSELADLIEDRPPASVERRLEDEPDFVDQVSFDRDAYRLVITLREDYLPSLDALRSRAPSLGKSRFRLLRMSGEQALQAVLRPGGALVSREVATEIVRFVGRSRIDSPFGDAAGPGSLAELDVDPALLSLICRELNERRIADGSPQVTAALLAGSREDILRAFYEGAFAGQPEALRDFVEDELITESGIRESMATERAERTLAAHGVAPRCLSVLVDRRLLHVEERLDMPRVEVIHDVLSSVILRSRAERRQRRALAAAAEQAASAARLSRRRRMRWAGAAAAAAAIVLGGGWLVAALRNEAVMRTTIGIVDASADTAIRTVIEKTASRSDSNCDGVLPLVSDTSLIEGLQGSDPENPRYAGAAAVLVAIKARCSSTASDENKAAIRELNARVRSYVAVLDRHPGDTNPDHLFWALFHLGRAARAANEPDASIDDLRRALGLLAERPSSEPVVRWRIDTLLSLTEAYSDRELFADVDRTEDEVLGEIGQLPEDTPQKTSDKFERRTIVYDFLGRSKLRRKRKADEAHDADAARLNGTDAASAYERALAAALEAQRAQPTLIWTERLVAGASMALGDAYLQVGDLTRGEAVYEREAASRRELLFSDQYQSRRINNDDAAARISLGAALQRLGSAHRALGREADAVATLERCVSDMLTLVDLDNRPPSRQALGLCRVDLADLHSTAGQTAPDRRAETETAIGLYRKALEDLARAADDPALTDAPRRALSAARSAATLLEETGQLPEAVAVAGRRIAVARMAHERAVSYGILDRDDAKSRLAGALQSRAWLTLLTRHLPEAEKDSRDAMALAPDDLWIATNLAHALTLQGRFGEARPIYEKILAGGDEELIAAVRKDFADFAALGITAPDLDSARRLFG